MTRCVDFYKKWQRDPNWCYKCEDAVRQIDEYIDLVKELEKRGVPSETTIVGLSEGAARPLLAIRNENIREEAVLSVSKSLKSGKNPVTGEFSKKPLTAAVVEQVIEKVSKPFQSLTEEQAAHCQDLQVLKTIAQEVHGLASALCAATQQAGFGEEFITPNEDEIDWYGFFCDKIIARCSAELKSFNYHEAE